MDLNLVYRQVLKGIFTWGTVTEQLFPGRLCQGLALDAKVSRYFFLNSGWDETIKVPLITFAGVTMGGSDG